MDGDWEDVEKVPEKQPEKKRTMDDFYEENKEYISHVETRLQHKVCIYQRRNEDKNAPWLLMIHGSCARMGQFEDQINALHKQFHIVAFDRIGCGKSEKPKDASNYSDSNIFEDLCTIFETYVCKVHEKAKEGDNKESEEKKEMDDIVTESPEIFLMGHSYGCSQALRLAHRYQHMLKIRGVCLFGCANILSEQLPFVVRSVFSLPDLMLGWMAPSLSTNFRANALHKESGRYDYLEALESTMVNPVYMFKAFYQQLKFIKQKDLDDMLTHAKDHPVPICMIHGAEDGIIPLTEASAVHNHLQSTLKAAFPTSDTFLLEFHSIDKCKHQVMQEKPDECTQIVLKFWEKCIAFSKQSQGDDLDQNNDTNDKN
ncbi:epoxide hydrolase [Reticulomyxa filosa]|uniref:Epoxide hydrolase n=1 Tax=Reticulomyxa filosa TaxID=46433 RepID=X6NPV8_RETFI|nr:epoxide hydrolase [Reticulomyxa filosa]|eukprot:ETO28056.1 epoxide hydrolase [Reticulomyxa filosa]